MSRRQELTHVRVKATTHPGLWLDKFAERGADGKIGAPQKAKLLDEAARCAADGYKTAFDRRLASFDADGCLMLEVEAEGRVAIGLGAKGPIENGITLEHTWGVPILPGSALKGLAAAAARKLADSSEWGPEGESYRELFGTNDGSGCVDFHDAWWIPDEKPSLAPDVMTVHHPDYYQDGKKPPTDFDSPTPIPFMTARGTFLVVLHGPEAWRKVAKDLLGLGLRELGIGAKTNAGYGRFAIRKTLGKYGKVEEAEKARAIREMARAAKVESAKRDLPTQLQGPQNATDIFGRFLALQEGASPAELRALGEALYAKNPKMWASWSKDDRRKDDEKDAFARYLAPQTTATAPAPAADTRPDQVEVVDRREQVQAYAVADSKGRLEVTVVGQMKTLKQQSVDVTLHEKLRASSKESPVTCIAVFRGDKLVKLESLS